MSGETVRSAALDLCEIDRACECMIVLLVCFLFTSVWGRQPFFYRSIKSALLTYSVAQYSASSQYAGRDSAWRQCLRSQIAIFSVKTTCEIGMNESLALPPRQ